ncbi:lipoic acid synthetase [Thermobaculum terrenum ATCC BAA-798]|uniref:Lipoyl synthase n=1 Tax=Thermobaculum terrenum (strain ATCC BAA-798 / CCMEE 7001 / YNP1) TaxID=525904 RepID=D1CDL2_THET1|nr:lipoyl synthase [Thermobaculum terrenum]ACZ41018.1 lipoic acid synthetase [Thermobaculum terrenum ATCC BAA-798]ACZ43716.1 lipoic acid synthetase [Thermobaculum terrenum ATCC BAA-798]
MKPDVEHMSDGRPAYELPKPSWIKARIPSGPNYQELKGLMRGLGLHTVCEEAHCPNIGDCWERRTATFMILGRVCTRSCGFCAVETGRPPEYDLLEPGRVAMAVSRLGLRHVVVTSVARDELPDGGAEIFARTIRAIHRRVPGCSVEVLIPDFRGQEDAIRKVVEAGPEIINHNVETVPRLHRRVRPQAKYERSLRVLELAGELGGEVLTKSGLMVGLGESRQELRDVMRDLRSVGVEILTVGQYLRPSREHLPVEKYYTPQEFEELKQEALELGFKHVESGPLVRSSYHADQQVSSLLQKAV